jgi:hypothetical protein
MFWLRWGLVAARPHLFIILLACAALRAAGPVRDLTWADIAPPLRQLLAGHGIREDDLGERLTAIRDRNRARVGEGERDHLVYYVLQSTDFTKLPPIEPAVSAKEFMSTGTVPLAVKARINAFNHEDTKARSTKSRSARMEVFRELIAHEPVDLAKEYARAMRFAAPAGALYQERGLSTDTTIDAGYVVYLSLSALRRLEPARQIRTVLIVGPGMDLAPRTGLVEVGEPQSQQPFAVVDALIASGLSTRDSLRVTAADINPRVTGWIRRLRGGQPTLSLVAGIREQGLVRLSEDYRDYFAMLGREIGVERPLRGLEAGRLGKSIAVAGGVTDVLDAETLDITTERIDAGYDLVVVTNVFPYLSDAELLLAIGNIVGMLTPGGVLIHNEPRPVLADALLALGLPLLQARSAVVATVEGGKPLYDAAWMHEVPRREPRTSNPEP